MSDLGDRQLPDDPVDAELPEHLQAILRVRWLDLIMRLEIPPARTAVAFALARFGNADGTNVFPGEQKVADMANIHESNAHKHIKALVAMGMLALKQKGGGRGRATNVYRLTRPTDITALPLWLDPAFDRVPEEGAFIPLAAEKQQAPAMVETEYPSPLMVESIVEALEYPSPAMAETAEYPSLVMGEGPVDNSGQPETTIVLDWNNHRFAPEYPSLALPDPKKTLEDQNPLWLLQVSTSLGEAITAAEPDVWTPDVEPLAPPVSLGLSAVVAPVDGAHDAALAILGAIPGGAAFFARRAARQLAAEGIQDPSPSAVAIRAAELARPNSESRSA